MLCFVGLMFGTYGRSYGAKSTDSYVPGAVPSPQDGFVIVPNDGFDLPYTTRQIYVGGTGNIAIQLRGNAEPVTLQSVPVGMYTIAASRILNTGTTATNMIGFY